MKHLVFGFIHRRGSEGRGYRTRLRLSRWEHLERAGERNRVGVHIVILKVAVVIWDGNRRSNEQRLVFDQFGPVSDGGTRGAKLVLPFWWCQRRGEMVRRGMRRKW